MYKLMICDDEALERIALRKIIERRYSNITVLEDAKTGKEAIKKARLFMPDILLMDIKMPELNGLDTQRELIRFHPGIKTVIITAYGEFSYAHEAIKYGVVDFLLKPVPPQVLYDSIDKILIGMPAAQAQTQQAQDAAPIIQEALAYIDAHYLDNLQLSDIAARVHLSEKYFSRYFKQQVGQSFTDYINLLRINRAKNFLLHTTAPIYKIAMDLNFSDAAYFTKVFLKYEKVTPYQFRQENKAGE